LFCTCGIAGFRVYVSDIGQEIQIKYFRFRLSGTFFRLEREAQCILHVAQFEVGEAEISLSGASRVAESPAQGSIVGRLGPVNGFVVVLIL
jgi:hypothetical protein